MRFLLYWFICRISLCGWVYQTVILPNYGMTKAVYSCMLFRVAWRRWREINMPLYSPFITQSQLLNNSSRLNWGTQYHVQPTKTPVLSLVKWHSGDFILIIWSTWYNDCFDHTEININPSQCTPHIFCQGSLFFYFPVGREAFILLIQPGIACSCKQPLPFIIVFRRIQVDQHVFVCL